MAYEFKNLNEIPAQDAPTENTTVMAFEGGVPRQIPVSSIKGGSVFVIDTTADGYDPGSVDYGNTVKDALLRGDIVWIFENNAYSAVAAFKIYETEDGLTHLGVLPAAKVSTYSSIGISGNNDNYALNCLDFVITVL